MAESVMKSHFPSQTVGDDVKLSMDYGLEVAIFAKIPFK